MKNNQISINEILFFKNYDFYKSIFIKYITLIENITKHFQYFITKFLENLNRKYIIQFFLSEISNIKTKYINVFFNKKIIKNH